MATHSRHALIDKELLECCICTETLTDPRSLPCGHSLCLQCLENDCRARSKNGKYPCPYCRQELKVPEQGIALIGCNMIVKNLADLMKQQNADYPCVTCQDGVPTSVCITCEGKRFCGECESQHRKHTSSHHIVNIQEFRDGKHDDAIRELQSSKCKQHNERYKYYCNKCRKLVCTDCVNLSCCRHTDSRSQISEAHEVAKNNLRQISDKVTGKVKKLEEHIEKILKNDALTSDTLSEQSQIIKDYYQKLMERLTKRDIQCLEKAHAENQAKRDKLKAKSQQELNRLNNLTRHMSRIITHGTATETLQLEQPLLKKVQASGEDEELQNVPEPLGLRYVPAYPDCAPADVEKVSGVLGGMAQCVFEFETRRPGEKDESHIEGLTVFPNGDILVTDRMNHKVERYNSKRELVGKPLVNAQLQIPFGVTHSPDGSVMVTCEAGVMTFSADGSTQLKKVKPRPWGLALTSKNQLVVTSGDDASPWVRLYSPAGKLVWEVGKDEKGKKVFGRPFRGSVNSRNDIIVGDNDLNAVFILDNHGKLVTKYGFTIGRVVGVCVDKDDFIYVARGRQNTVVSLTPDGHLHRVVVSGPDVVCPVAVTFDTQGRLVVSCKSEATKKYSTYIKAFKIRFA